jgi:hypothetical protein
MQRIYLKIIVLTVINSKKTVDFRGKLSQEFELYEYSWISVLFGPREAQKVDK